jgi:glucosylceramidase
MGNRASVKVDLGSDQLLTEYGTGSSINLQNKGPDRKSRLPAIVAGTVILAAVGMCAGIALQGSQTVHLDQPTAMIAQSASSIRVIESHRKKTTQMEESTLLFGQLPTNTGSSTLVVDSKTQFQKIEGFGGAFTEAAATVFAHLSETDQEKFLEAYFGASGIGYSIGRVHINSCDFSVASYSFDDVAGDMSLKHFDESVVG